MWDEYKKVNDSIHVPEELVNRTVKAAEREEQPPQNYRIVEIYGNSGHALFCLPWYMGSGV